MRATLGVRLALGAFAAMTLASCGVPQTADNGGGPPQESAVSPPKVQCDIDFSRLPKRTVEILELTPGESKQLPLEADQVTLPGLGGVGERRVAVSLARTEYQCKYVETIDGARREREGKRYCYELHGLPHPWAVWSDDDIWGYSTVLTNGPKANYFAWVESALSFADLATSRERRAALMEHLMAMPVLTSPSWRIYVDTVSTVPEEKYWGNDASIREIHTRSIKRIGESGWEVQLTGPDRSKVYTLICENGKWRRADASAPPPAAK